MQKNFSQHGPYKIKLNFGRAAPFQEDLFSRHGSAQLTKWALHFFALKNFLFFIRLYLDYSLSLTCLITFFRFQCICILLKIFADNSFIQLDNRAESKLITAKQVLLEPILVISLS